MSDSTKRLIPLAAMERILKQAGAERVSDKAKTAMKEVVEEIVEKISKDAIRYAEHAGRKTVKSEDIKLAVKQR